jgi:hypothetical protein
MADNGIAIMLTNCGNLWSPSPRVSSNDRELHINEGVTLTGVLRWAKDLHPRNTRELAGSYPVERLQQAAGDPRRLPLAGHPSRGTTQG